MVHKQREGLRSQAGALPVVTLVKGLLKETASGICRITADGAEARLFVTGTSVFFIQPSFKEFPSRKIEFRDGVASYLKSLSSISSVSTFTFDVYHSDDVFVEMMEWMNSIRHVRATYKTKVMITKVTSSQWQVIDELS